VQLSGEASPYIGHVLDEAFKHAQAVLAFFTPDEHAAGRGVPLANKGAWRLQARPNVLIEAGMALVTHPRRTVIVVLGDQELPSDLAGRHYIQLDNTSGPLYELANRLAEAGCELDRTGPQWLDPANFPSRDNLISAPPHRANSATRPRPAPQL
jgi:predicted nucleotide-binding protein